MEDITKVICGVCHDEWLTNDEYLNHVCPVTGFTPQQPEHLINSTTPDFAAISQAAIERGAADQAATEDTPTDTPADPTINLG